MQQLVHRLSEIFRTGEVEYSEATGAFLALIWGLGLLFVKEPRLDVAPPAIAAILFGVAVLQLWGIRNRSYRLRRAGSMLAIMGWMFVAAEAGDAGNAWSFVICPSCIALAAGSAWGFYRIARRYEALARVQART